MVYISTRERQLRGSIMQRDGIYKQPAAAAGRRSGTAPAPWTCCIDPRNPRVLFAGTWEAWRKPWTLSSGSPGGGLFPSTDGGGAARYAELSD
jgi:hypothetical protein